MDAGMYDLVENILNTVSFIAIGGALAIVFFVVFAQSILGSRTTQKQLKNIEKQTEKMAEQLKKIAERLEKSKEQQ